MDKELTTLERAIIALVTIGIIGLWIWVLLVFRIQNASQFTKTCIFVVMGLTFVVLCVLWFFVIDGYAHKKRREAWMYILEKTQGVYFYGYPVADCLCSNVAAELRWNHVGDFSRTLGFVVLYTLRNDKKNALLYIRRVENTPDRPEHDDAFVCFHYGGKYWQFNLNQPLNDAQCLTRVSVNNEEKSLTEKGYLGFDFWMMPLEWRIRIDRCADPGKSFFCPDINYTEEDGLSHNYKNLVQKNIMRAIRIWYRCERSGSCVDETPQRVTTE